MNQLYRSWNAFTTVLIPSPNNLKPEVIRLLLNKKSRNAEIALPTLAVIPSILILSAPETVFSPLNAALTPPEIIDRIISKMANNPLKVSLIFPAVSSLICKVSVKS